MESNEEKKNQVQDKPSVVREVWARNVAASKEQGKGKSFESICRNIGEEQGLLGLSWENAVDKTNGYLVKRYPGIKFTEDHDLAIFDGFKVGRSSFLVDAERKMSEAAMRAEMRVVKNDYSVPSSIQPVNYWEVFGKVFLVFTGVVAGVAIYKSINSTQETKQIARRKLTENVIDGGLSLVKNVAEKKLLK